MDNIAQLTRPIHPTPYETSSFKEPEVTGPSRRLSLQPAPNPCPTAPSPRVHHNAARLELIAYLTHSVGFVPFHPAGSLDHISTVVVPL
jgi:hypothetical protein